MAVGSITSGAQIPVAPQFTAAQLNAYAGNDWITNGGNAGNDRYSSLTSITPSNVGSLQQAWSTDLGVCAETQLLVRLRRRDADRVRRRHVLPDRR